METTGSDLIATVNYHSDFLLPCCPPPWTNTPPQQFRRATANQLSSSRSQLYTLYMFYTAKNLLSSFRVFSVFRGSNHNTLSRGTLRSLRAHFVRLPSESKAFFGASVPGLEHTLSPRGVCSRIPHTMSR